MRSFSLIGGSLSPTVVNSRLTTAGFVNLELTIVALHQGVRRKEPRPRIERVAGRLFEGRRRSSMRIERIVARLGLQERRGLGFQAETEPLRLHQVVITAKPYASTPSKSTIA